MIFTLRQSNDLRPSNGGLGHHSRSGRGGGPLAEPLSVIEEENSSMSFSRSSLGGMIRGGEDAGSRGGDGVVDHSFEQE
ncbi:unnamed protein product [Amoebophrya sp. A120]|nr:unnamed protein product [Amoebophrya sp. A120]|eukprot:GSA120T00000912001.1